MIPVLRFNWFGLKQKAPAKLAGALIIKGLINIKY
jgi:hypothetical protein